MLAGGFVAMLIGISMAFPKFVLNDPENTKARRLDRDHTPMPAGEMARKLIPIVLFVILVLGGFTPVSSRRRKRAGWVPSARFSWHCRVAASTGRSSGS